MSFIDRFMDRITPRTVVGVRRAWGVRGQTVVNEDTAMMAAAYNRGVIYISTQVAKLPWRLKDKDRKTLDNSVANLLELQPNPEMNSFTFRLLAIQTAINHGNFYAEIERNGSNVPIAIWPIMQKVEPLRTVSGNLVYRVYGGDTSGSGQDVFLPPRDVFHIKNFHTKDGIAGQGVIAYAMETLGINLAADKMASGIFHNSGIPSGVLTVTGTLSDEAYTRLENSWKEKKAGRKSGSTAILEEGTKYEPMNVTPDLLQFVESRQFTVQDVARFLGVPPTKLFDTTASTYSNVENANLEVATDTLDSWAKNLEMEADIKILNSRFGGRFTQLELYDIFRGDAKTRSDYAKTMMSVAAINPNEIREREGYPGYGPQGDNFYIATNNYTPVNRMDEVIDAQIASKNKPTPPTETDEDKELKNAAISFLKK